jgi:predicted AlkP superfamily phosphohydrolase/phosphomutase
VLSDHGFGPYEGNFFTNRWLLEKGYLVPRPCRLGRIRECYRLTAVRASVDRLLGRAGLARLSAALPESLRRLRLVVPRVRRNPAAFVDWRQTRAYGAAYGIRINLAGREPHGCVAAGADYEKLRDELLAALREIPDPKDGSPVVDMAERREGFHRGPLAEEAPDILFSMKDLSYITENRLLAPQCFSPSRLRGTHRMEGILVARGPGLRAGGELEGARLQDIMPTLLYAAGLPVPDDLDGRVLQGCFDPAQLEAQPPSYEAAPDFTADDHSYSTSEDDEIRRRLQALGYME